MGKLRLSLFSFTRADLEIEMSNQIAFERNFDLLEVFCLAKVSCKGISLELKAPAENKDGVSH